MTAGRLYICVGAAWMLAGALLVGALHEPVPMYVWGLAAMGVAVLGTIDLIARRLGSRIDDAMTRLEDNAYATHVRTEHGTVTRLPRAKDYG